ncbi:MAG TPA: hypothetical protein DDW17_05465 [Deltaproteobacteria bacterium]|nr:hypothetical protein [Deltaproteobacteria bacterium]
MINNYNEFRNVLFPLLRCVYCDNSQLTLVKENFSFDLPIHLHQEHILCNNCGNRYPISEDIIPIMWSSSLREHFTNKNNQISNLEANILIYDAISDNYQLYTRQYPGVAKRIQNAVTRIVEHENNLYHLDFGCGPGHVLGWLKSKNFISIGMDVSINNLRNARKNTGSLVVCGDATCMPFCDKSINIVTESSVLHHIYDWKPVIYESCRICKHPGGIIIDSEPSKETKAWSPIAVAIFNLRFTFYKALSYIMKNKYMFRNIKQAKLNLLAEVHNKPGGGFPLDELRNLFEQNGFSVEIILSPTHNLVSKANPNWKSIILNILSGHNPWNPKYGSFMAIAKYR